MPKKQWTKLDVQRRITRMRGKLNLLESMLLNNDFGEERYNYLRNLFSSWWLHLKENLKGMRKALKEKADA